MEEDRGKIKKILEGAKFIKDAIARGEQCYIVCPAVEENETNIKSAEELADELANGEFKGCNLGILHGKMKPKDKEAIMKLGAKGVVEIDNQIKIIFGNHSK